MGYPSYDLTFKQFQRRNAERCRVAFDPDLHTVEFFMIAIAGETGEMCNLYKKVMRGDFSLETQRTEILNELADIITYCDLLITKLGADTEDVLIDKFRTVSKRRGYEE